MPILDLLRKFILEFAYLFNEMALYLLIGFFFAGVLHLYFPKRLILSRLGASHFMSNVWAALFGVPLPLCSCGVVPAGIALRKSGASKGATVSFLTATPQTGVDSILVTYSFFGWTLSIFKVFAALISGVVGGLLVDRFDRDADDKELDRKSFSSETIAKHIEREGVRDKSLKAFTSYFLRDQPLALRKWMLLGLFLATLISMGLPKDFAALLNLNENLFLSYFIFLAIGIPMYICSTGSVPVAAALLAKGFPAGGIFVFLMAGPATNAASIAMLYKTLGKKSLWIYVASLIGCSLFFGWAFDAFYPGIGPELSERFQLQNNVHQHGSNFLIGLRYFASALLVLLFTQDYFRKVLYFLKSNDDQKKLPIEVIGMTCGKCLAKVTSALQEDPLVNNVDLKQNGFGNIFVDPKSDTQDLRNNLINKLKDAGYELKL